MPYTTVVAGTTITASWANTNVRDQVVSTFANSADRNSAIGSPTEGMLSFLTGTNRVDVYNAAGYSALVNPAHGAWVDYSASAEVQQSASYLARTVGLARYIRIGRLCTYAFSITLAGSGTAGQHVNILLPFDHALGGSTGGHGTGGVVDVSASLEYPAFVVPSTAAANLAWFRSTASTALDARLGVATFTAALATGDVVNGSLTYQTASDD